MKGRRGIAALVLALGATLVAVGCFMAAWLVGRPVPESVSPAVEPVYATIVEAAYDGNRQSQVRLTIIEGERVLSGGGGSTVTAVSISDGDVLRDGRALYSVDGQGVWAVVGEIPMYRALRWGDKGADVEVLQRFLNTYLEDSDAEVTGEVNSGTVEMIRKWQRQAGLPVNGVADSSRFVRIDGELTVGKVEVWVGMAAPALGDVVLQGADVFESLTAVDSNAADAQAGEYVFVTSGQSLPLLFDGATWSPVDQEGALAFAAVFDEATGASESTLRGGRSGSREVVVDGRLAWAEPIEVSGVPPSALVSGVGESVCVWLAKSSDPGIVGVESEAATDLDVVGISVTGTALVRGTELVGRDVLLNPSEFVDKSTCP